MFKVEDVVEAFGIIGTVTEVTNNSVEAKFGTERGIATCRFYTDGKVYWWSTEPSLKLISRPKQKVKRILYPAITMDIVFGQYYQESLLFTDLEQARSCPAFSGEGGRDKIVVRLGPPVEIEVEE